MQRQIRITFIILLLSLILTLSFIVILSYKLSNRKDITIETTEVIVIAEIGDVALEENVGYIIARSGLNLRAYPTTKSESYLVIPFGEEIIYYEIESTDEWVKVCYNEELGYVKKEFISNEKVNNRWRITLTDDEVELLAKIISLEFGNQTDEGQQAGIESVFNRMISYHYGGSLEHVLSAPGQYTTWKNRNSANPENRVYTNIYLVLNGETDILGSKYYYFATSKSNGKNFIKIDDVYFSEQK